MTKRRKFSREYKIETVKLFLDGSKSLSQVSRELGIRRGVLQRWRDEYQSDPVQAFPGSGHLSPDGAELAKVKREYRRVKMENEILKKAIAIFSKEPK